jgi:DNA-binding transcriptional LysR family regulator
MPAFSRFLRYFMTVGRLGSIRKAADELNVSASAIDRQILNVEADIGMPLFDRLPTGLRLTAAGEIMMAAGGRWQKSLVDVRAQLEDLRGLKRGHVDIAIIDALTKGYIPTVIQQVQTRYPGITVGLRVLGNDLVRRAIADGEVDFGICFEPESFRDLTVQAFTEIDLGFVAPVGHPFCEQPLRRFSACVGTPVIVPVQPLAVHEQIAILEGVSRVTLDKKVLSNNIQTIISLVLGGSGISILTWLDVATEVRAGLLSFAKISDPILRPMTLALCTAASRSPTYAADIVLGEIQAGFAQLGFPATLTAPES